jgi:hypothetical protein
MTAVSTISSVNHAIISGQFTNDQLDSIIMAIKFARNQLATKAKFTLVKGTKVKFTSSRTGQPILGTVEKVNRKFIVVRENKANALVGSLWRVPANMLEAV